MSRTYSVTGINLKSIALGESDRLLTILTPEVGLLRAVASGARKQNSKLGGRTALFVVNDCLIAKGRTLDRLVQAETQFSFQGLSRDLSRLTAGQYLAELALIQAVEGQPQVELFEVLQSGLRSLESCPPHLVLAHLVHQIFKLLTLAGLAPEVQVCCVTRRPVIPDFAVPHWSIEFNVSSGGMVSAQPSEVTPMPPPTRGQRRSPRLAALPLAFLQQLHLDELPPSGKILGCPLRWNEDSPNVLKAWLWLERILHEYIQYNFDRPIRSAELLAGCFASPSAPLTGVNPP
jgi:DNA repair protein RecO (recombination protein O)